MKCETCDKEIEETWALETITPSLEKTTHYFCSKEHAVSPYEVLDNET